jgi:hypothetical protein
MGSYKKKDSLETAALKACGIINKNVTPVQVPGP